MTSTMTSSHSSALNLGSVSASSTGPSISSLSLILGQYRLIRRLGSGNDGVWSNAEDIAVGAQAEYWDLSRARGDELRWPVLEKRLRGASQLRHPWIRKILNLRLNETPPFLIREAASEPAPPNNWPEFLLKIHRAAEALAEAHALGLRHGSLNEAAVETKLDFCRLRDGRSSAPGHPSDDPAEDVRALGSLMLREMDRLASNQTAMQYQELLPFLLKMTQAEPEERPTMAQVVDELRPIVDLSCATNVMPASAPGNAEPDPSAQAPKRRPGHTSLAAGQMLGRFLLLEKLGQGAMGAVFRAQDTTDDSIVAVKVLLDTHRDQNSALVRFHKEARLLSKVNNEFVTRLIEIIYDNTMMYLVMEYVPGKSIGDYLRKVSRLPEAAALSVISDVAHGLESAHEQGILHRDIKPDNILTVSDSIDDPRSLRVKLSDFGLARNIEDTQSMQVTQAGMVVGTPLYMSPEQCAGKTLGPQTDVYSMGATLFHMLAGVPPFTNPNPMMVLAMHQNNPLPLAKLKEPAVSEGVIGLIEKAMAKRPEARYPNAEEFRKDVERLRRGEPAAIAVHPRIPLCDPKDRMDFDWTWELNSPPTKLWPYVSNTERLNRALGLSHVDYQDSQDPKLGLIRKAVTKKAGVALTWREHPFEWIEGKKIGVLREYEGGPFRWLVSVMEVQPRPGGGAMLSHRIRMGVRGMLGRTLASFEIGGRMKKAFERTYRRIDSVLAGELGDPAYQDPFESAERLPRARSQRLNALLKVLENRKIDPEVTEALGLYIRNASSQDLARIRPLALARRLRLDPDQVTAACLQGAKEGLFILLWDVLCPVCRIPSEVKDSLRALSEHGNCEACNLNYDLDFANSVEMIFRIHPEIRATELKTYCKGGPGHSPHVAAQARVGPGERMELVLELEEGTYRVRGPQLPWSWEFQVRSQTRDIRVEMPLKQGPSRDWPKVLKPEAQILDLYNESDMELMVRVERLASRDDAFTAEKASANPLFRQLFADQTLAPGRLINVSQVCLLQTDLDGAETLYSELGDAKAFGILHEHFLKLQEIIKAEGGAIIKTVGEGVVAAFNTPLAAVNAGLGIIGLPPLQGPNGPLHVKVSAHRGPAMAANLNDRLDYFGSAANLTGRLRRWVGPREMALTSPIVDDPQVSLRLRASNIDFRCLDIEAPNLPRGYLHSVRLCEFAGIAADSLNGEEEWDASGQTSAHVPSTP